MNITGPVELSKKAFLKKLREPEGFIVLIEDYSIGCYFLCIYRKLDMVIYASPLLYPMGLPERGNFAVEVEDAALHPGDAIKRIRW